MNRNETGKIWQLEYTYVSYDRQGFKISRAGKLRKTIFKDEQNRTKQEEADTFYRGFPQTAGRKQHKLYPR